MWLHRDSSQPSRKNGASKNGASHQIWAICKLTQIWWLAPFYGTVLAAAEGVGRGGDADAGQGDRARLGHDHEVEERSSPPCLEDRSASKGIRPAPPRRGPLSLSLRYGLLSTAENSASHLGIHSIGSAGPAAS
jgi:hypothetical protein